MVERLLSEVLQGRQLPEKLLSKKLAEREQLPELLDENEGSSRISGAITPRIFF
ncbi:MAG: hypothetical protein ABIB47_04350 [Candidatus Woesearchaeota archaeon]